MKSLLTIVLTCLVINLNHSQTETAKDGVIKACSNYIEGFYEGDTDKLEASLQPTLNKFGFWKDKNTGEYQQQDHMSYDKAIAYAKRVLKSKNFAKKDAPKKIEVLDLGNSIASAKITAWWGIDYILLSKRGDKWMIEQVLWEGPLEK